MKWEQINKLIYFKDGSLRDIYVLKTNIDDWKKWISFINKNYNVEFFDRRFKDSSSEINFNKVLEYWKKVNEDGVYAKISISGITVMCYFNEESMIESDFSPAEIKNIENHNSLIDYLSNMSKCLNKHVLVTNEMKEDEILIDVFMDAVNYR